uniref:DNA polymerase n=1 Tax=Corethron hystrix TaxID=216773 RepID=A0A7S1B342_9STRA|mmetsp:Transcript_10904/g.23954  ORF Transcript_10904/g.23954 Transcript_10904/m.23954 type:complete len:1025 (+) Transcript_10904:131-3205(+)
MNMDLESSSVLRLRGGGERGGGGGGESDIEETFDPQFEYTEEPPLEEEEGDCMEIPEEYETGSSVNASDHVSRRYYPTWIRPSIDPVTVLEGGALDLDMQCTDLDILTGYPLQTHPASTHDQKSRKVPGPSVQQPCPILRLYGSTREGASVCAYVHGFSPYAFFSCPDSYVHHGNDMRHCLNDLLRSGVRSSDGRDVSVFCHGVKYHEGKRSLLGYVSAHQKFLQVYVASPTMVPTLKRIMEEGIELPRKCRGDDGEDDGHVRFEAYEANVPFVLRFMIDIGMTGGGWVTLPSKRYRVRVPRKNAPGAPKRQRTAHDGHFETPKMHCQIEVDVTFNDMIPRDPNDSAWSGIAPLRILSFDIECAGRRGHFPEAKRDPVIQIANVLSSFGKEENVRTIFTLGSCLPVVGAQVVCSDTEEEMLEKWREYLEATDPDILTGYNVQNFDIPYLLDRAEALTNDNSQNSKLHSFALWGRVKGQKARMKDTTFQSAAFGKRSNIETTIDGRVIFDMLPYMQRNHKLSSYTLNSVCSEFLGQQKEDVHHSIIATLQNGTDEDRHRLATYCLKDALLPQLLMNKLSVLVNFIEMARVTGVTLEFLIARGQQIKVFSMILRKCRNENLLVPTLSKTGANAGGDGYEGATVLEPMKAYYDTPIATLDFASLYPSIMQAYNLCYSTLISPADLKGIDPSLYKKSENGHVFVHSTTKKGILPIILEELLTARKKAKRDMKNAKSDYEKAVQNGRQLALKVSANSVYGFTGATVGQLPCLPIASTVTSYGRFLLERTKAFVEEKYTISNGYKHDAVVIYGDTDSVMVKFGTKTVEESFPLAIEAADRCSEIFPKPIHLEFEKVYFPYLLMNKKRYAGLMWTQTDKYDYMDTKGLETVRRDNCALVREVIQTSLDKILIGRDVPGAIDYVKSQISDLLQNKMDISRLVITKSLNKGAEYALGLGGKKEDYKVKQAHVELAARMKKRDPGSAPQMGDRVPYVMCAGVKNAPNFEKSEDPIYVLGKLHLSKFCDNDTLFS